MRARTAATTMFTLTCSLRFRDGTTVSAQVKAQTKTEDALVRYSGCVERLPLMASKATAVELQAYFTSFARELRARYEATEVDDRVIPAYPLDEGLEYLVALGAVRRCAEKQASGGNHHPKSHHPKAQQTGKPGLHAKRQKS